MRNGLALLSIVAAAGLACPAMAQDSVSKNSDAGNGLPGDALSAWATGTAQKASYVVDLNKFFSSGSTQFGIGILAKCAKTDSTHFNSLFSGTCISQTLRSNAAYAASNYTLWTAAKGGVNSAENNTALNSSVPVSGLSTRFGAAMAEFSTSDGGFNVSNIVTTMVNYDASQPDRLYVQRTMAAVNMPNGTTGDSSQFGTGSIDADGNLHFRADGVSTAGANPLTGINYFRTNVLSRNAATINFFSNAGGSDAAAGNAWLLVNTTVAHNTPSGIPADLASRPVLLGSNFNIQYLHEATAGSLTAESAATYLAAPATDIRGGVSFSQKNFFGGVGTAGILGKTGADTDALCLWGVTAAGAVTNKTTLVRPSPLTDGCYSFNFTGVFDGYRSQVAFRGGNGCVAIGQDRQGRGLAAAVVYSSASATNPSNGIAVVRFDPSNPTGTAQWTLAAWNDVGSISGKPLKGDYGADGVAFTGDAGEFDGVVDATDAPIGRLALAPEVAALVGPSMSSPAFDSAGNIYFLSAVALKKLDQDNNPVTDFDFALVRGIYNADTFCYDLELVLEPGDTFVGKNSNTRYQIRFLDVPDSNSISSGSLFSGNVNQATWNNYAVPASTPNSAAENLGGLVIGAKIVYDVDGDTNYDDPTSANGSPLSVDEAYSVLLYIGNPNVPANPCPADFNGDGFVTGDDFDLYVAVFELGDPPADFNGDGFVTGDDFDLFVAAFELGC